MSNESKCPSNFVVLHISYKKLKGKKHSFNSAKLFHLVKGQNDKKTQQIDQS